MTRNTTAVPNNHQKQVEEVSTFYQEASSSATSTFETYENQERKYKAPVLVYKTSKQSKERRRHDVQDSNQVTQLGERLYQRDNDIATMIAQIKAITTKLKAKGKILGAIPSTSVQIQSKVPYNSVVLPSTNKEFSWHIS